MANYPGGWLTLENSNPVPVTNSISLAQLFDGVTTTNGEVKHSTNYYAPTGGTWAATPITLNAEPTIAAVNVTLSINETVKASAINMQTKMANLTAPPPPLKNLLYLYGNPNDNQLNYYMKIPINLGASNYTSLQLSVMENAATSGDEHGRVEVIDFGTGPFTGVITLNVFFSGYFGAINLGLRLESTVPQSSICELRCLVMPVNS